MKIQNLPSLGLSCGTNHEGGKNRNFYFSLLMVNFLFEMEYKQRQQEEEEGSA